MKTYFINWDIIDDNGKVFKYVNSIIESDGTPKEVFNKVMEGLEKEFGADKHCRAITFNKV